MHGLEAQNNFATTSVAIRWGVLTIVMVPTGNPMWGCDLVKAWADCHQLKLVKLRSCSISSQPWHVWLREIGTPDLGKIFSQTSKTEKVIRIPFSGRCHPAKRCAAYAGTKAIGSTSVRCENCSMSYGSQRSPPIFMRA